MRCVEAARVLTCSIVGLAVLLQCRSAAGFVSTADRYAGSGSLRGLRIIIEMTNQPESLPSKAPTTRHAMCEEVATLAAIFAGGAAMVADAADANALSMDDSLIGNYSEEDRRGVEETTIRWKDTVTSGRADAPRLTASLYAPDAVLWGTVSEEVRDTPSEIYDYFEYFARLPKLRLSEYTPACLRVFGDFATQAGTYTFVWKDADGRDKEKRARFSFTFRRDANSPTGWIIVDHHSSAMPISPAQLKHVRNDMGLSAMLR